MVYMPKVVKPSKRKHSIGFSHALDGLKYAVGSQPNFQIHLAISTVVLALMLVLPVSRTEVVMLLFCIMLGLVVELVNTAIESVVDLVTDEWHQSAKIAKDVAAGTMLLTAVGTSLIGMILLLPHLLNYLGF